MNQKDLPIYQVEEEFVSALADSLRVIIHAPTGSGKSTQIPQMLLDRGLADNGQVMILQPRRLATRMLAARVASERRERLGGEVGYQIRFEDFSGPETRIKFVTEGILLRQMLSNPRLDGIGTIIFDEFHERHLYGDITLARALQIQETLRPDLRIIVMSATLAVEELKNYLGPNTRIISSEGRTFPVEARYLRKADESPIWDQACEEFERLVTAGVEGDFLIFMPGAYEIARTVQMIQASRAAKGFIVMPLHGELPPREQDAAVSRYDTRKVVVSTNVAETSLTIDGIRVVIDSGLARIPKYDPQRGINTLLIDKISRASADQRAGRAGRTAPGVCVRLWTEADHRLRAAQEIPEINRLDLSEVILTLKAAGVEDIRAFRWLEAPKPQLLDRAETLLRDLGALDLKTGQITSLGRRMLSFPVHPRYARMLLAAQDYKCVYPVALIAALTQGRSILMRGGARDVRDNREDILGSAAESDFFMLMRAWTFADKRGYNLDTCKKLGIHAQSARQVRPLFEHFLRIAKQEGLDTEPGPTQDEAIQKCILTGFIDHLAVRVDASSHRCLIIHGRKGQLSRDSVVTHAPLVVAAEVHEIEGRGGELNVSLEIITAVKEEWLREIFPDGFRETIETVFDAVQRRVTCVQRKLFCDLPLSQKNTDATDPEGAARVLAREVLKKNLILKEWTDEVNQWFIRVNFLAQHCPELGLSSLGKDDITALIEQFCLGAHSYKDIKDKPLWPTLREWLSPAQFALVDKHAPERLDLPSGKRGKITYFGDGTTPKLSTTIQNLFGLKSTPAIAMGRVPLLVEILAPNQRPVQVTTDLTGFWTEHYPKLKAELSRRYPRHEWR
ncbi:ATP-dependent helicase HrpB [Oscillatoria amoena NRMC-F 0135]|nr:ATP-dependent helicase HrpB [Oscillatoria laete-virens]MDL5046017.1 ATP-dependent helicase HrpB [Oscillatoria amoena NRMC-F 0135]MDL5052723.1 ATP-dependent helicase HrpB [Oscillatoria laete-virens NRMC-F 0139]